MDQKKLGAYLKQLRKEKGLTQEQLAEQFYLSSRTVSRWETGETLPGVELLLELADFYAVDIRQLLAGGTEAAPTDALRQVARYTATQEQRAYTRLAAAALGLVAAVAVATVLLIGPTQGLLYGIVPEQLCRDLLLLVYGTAAAAAVAFLKAWGFQETPSREPQRTVAATVVSKAVKPGTHGAGRSKGGFSYTVCFRTAAGETLELYAYEVEFGGLKEGRTGQLTHQGRYFIRFEEK